jgi:hypothetical protein
MPRAKVPEIADTEPRVRSIIEHMGVNPITAASPREEALLGDFSWPLKKP